MPRLIGWFVIRLVLYYFYTVRLDGAFNDTLWAFDPRYLKISRILILIFATILVIPVIITVETIEEDNLKTGLSTFARDRTSASQISQTRNGEAPSELSTKVESPALCFQLTTVFYAQLNYIIYGPFYM